MCESPQYLVKENVNILARDRYSRQANFLAAIQLQKLIMNYYRTVWVALQTSHKTCGKLLYMSWM